MHVPMRQETCTDDTDCSSLTNSFPALGIFRHVSMLVLTLADFQAPSSPRL